MRVRSTVVVLAIVCHASSPARAQFEDVTIDAAHVRGPIYMLTGRGGNIGVSAGPDGILIVDDQFAPLADKIRAALDKLAKPAGELEFVLNTHWHGDHTGSNPIFGAEASIIAHDNVRQRLMDPPVVPGRRIEPMDPQGLPVITFDHSISLHFNGETIRVTHLPRGHTDGDSVVFFTGSNVIHLGDHFFAGRFPYVDLDSGGDVAGLVANVGGLIEALPADVKIIPGHGGLSTLDDLRNYHEMLVATVGIVRERIAEGRSLDEIKAAGWASKWQAWGSGFISGDRWFEIVHRSLTD